MGSKSSSFAILRGLESRKKGWQLEDKSYLALMGGIDLDLTVADIPDREIYLDLTAIMGGVDIKVPEDLNVLCYGSAFLGG
ncbi:MAG: LiaF-related protein [Methanosarcinaceae archaeon]|nr:LiaF-related protein [Methanosarcinaceae archaeon]MDD4748667.1 LiaF-related protein [Methanosarcinaceae archaeon]